MIFANPAYGNGTHPEPQLTVHPNAKMRRIDLAGPAGWVALTDAETERLIEDLQAGLEALREGTRRG